MKKNLFSPHYQKYVVCSFPPPSLSVKETFVAFGETALTRDSFVTDTNFETVQKSVQDFSFTLQKSDKIKKKKYAKKKNAFNNASPSLTGSYPRSISETLEQILVVIHCRAKNHLHVRSMEDGYRIFE
ncbi:hypothetical protein NPIL_222791 [Nephila pilipes]|uniref:Uncharacterized protein n=1 Tax=Nephila pilipes TaxID=299642 RepID=A0A8X6Q4N1_NEPPI|nr:hypothetical protein NPIL_222791 [Nephila pilipes]